MQQLNNKKAWQTSDHPARRHGVLPEARRNQKRSDRGASDVGDLFAKIDRLAELCERGLVTEKEFEAKKRELLGRI